MMVLLLLLAGTIFLAYANGANDNFKGVATLAGSGTTTVRRALIWATACTMAGGVFAVFWADRLLQTFSGKGLVANTVVGDPVFLTAVALGAALTVMVATRLGLPVSTTHALLGALVGSGLVVSGGSIAWTGLSGSFVIPLLVSPFLAILLALIAYPPLRWSRRRLNVTSNTCVCVSPGRYVPITARSGATAVTALAEENPIIVDDASRCVERYAGEVMGVSAAAVVDRVHYLSAGAVSFARGLNDTPKIVALLLSSQALAAATGWFTPRYGFVLVTVCIAVGGLLSAAKVARTMSRDITSMNVGQGLTANLVTAFLVLIASRFGMPVSTTHVSCGALFGIGAVTRQAKWRTIGVIALAWVTTLPLAAALGAAVCLMLRQHG